MERLGQAPLPSLHKGWPSAPSKPLTGHDAGDVGDNNRLAEHGPVEDIADGTVGRLPHLLQLELWNAADGMMIGIARERRRRQRDAILTHFLMRESSRSSDFSPWDVAWGRACMMNERRLGKTHFLRDFGLFIWQWKKHTFFGTSASTFVRADLRRERTCC